MDTVANIYYMVHNPAKGAPTKRHIDKSDAVEEAKRLAREHIGQMFYVLKTVECYSVVQPEPVSIPLE